MDGVVTSSRTSYGLSLLVALGWFVVVPAAVFVGLSGVPDAPAEDCEAMFSCLSPAEEVGILFFFFGLPFLAGAMVVAAVTAALLVRVLRSPVVTGSVSALCGVVVAVAVAAAWHGAA